ncbi:LysR substrate-binding domain-containing protein [Marinomonas arenicola]|uniref:LysR substrate-binding domain-containing protein n=1 Tax=Marinomonas arenicola TaxID=569601 RepID=A0ABU9G3V2_9GAMM
MPINNRTIPSLSGLILFEASSRLGTFSSAAEELCVTPTAVSKQIKQLENFLNTQLFIRKKNGLELTQKGKIYLETVSSTLLTLAEASQQMNDEQTPCALDLEIGTCFSHFWLIPRLDDFRDKHPDITLNININNQRNISKESQSDYHVAFYYGPVETVNKDHKLLFKERILLVCSPNFLSKRPTIQSLDTLWEIPLLGLKNAPNFWENWQSWAEKSGIEYQIPKNEIQMEDQVTVIHAALNGAGVAMAWDWQVDEFIKNGQLVALNSAIECDSNAFFLTHNETSNQQASKHFIHWVTELVSEQKKQNTV